MLTKEEIIEMCTYEILLAEVICDSFEKVATTWRSKSDSPSDPFFLQRLC